MSDAPRVLFVANTPPAFDADAGSRQIHERIVMLHEAGWRVTFFAPRRASDPRHAEIMTERGIPVLQGDAVTLGRVLEIETPDCVVFAGWQIAEYLLPVVRRAASSARVAIEALDLHLLRFARETLAGGRGRLLDGGYGEEAIAELNVYAAADTVISVSEREAGYISDLTGDPVLGQTVPLSAVEAPPPVGSTRAGLLFVGSFRHTPNVDAIEYFTRDIQPLLRAEPASERVLTVVGNALTPELLARLPDDAAIQPVGWAPDLAPWFGQARVFVAPLRFGAGVKGKLIEAMLAGLPVVTTSIGAEGLNLTDGRHLLVADDAPAFAAAVDRLLTDPDLAGALATAGNQAMRERHGREAVGARLQSVLTQTQARPAKPPLLPMRDRDHYETRLATQFARTLARRLATLLDEFVPPRETPPAVIVAHRGLAPLLRLPGYDARPFPGDQESREVIDLISALEQERCAGGELLVLPNINRRWLDPTGDFERFLAEHYQRLNPPADPLTSPGVIYDLRQPRPAPDGLLPIALVWPDLVSAAGSEPRWTIAARARPLFPGHRQPRLPEAGGFGDPRLLETRQAAADLARQFGIAAFGYLYERPVSGDPGRQLLDLLTADPAPDFPFCPCWAPPREDAFAAPDDLDDHAACLHRWLSDPRAIRIAGAPLLVIVPPADARLHEVTAVLTELWRRLRDRGDAPWLAGAVSSPDQLEAWDETEGDELSALLALPPMESAFRRKSASGDGPPAHGPAKALAPGRKFGSGARRPVFPALAPAWDDTPREGGSGVVIAPGSFAPWLNALQTARRQLDRVSPGPRLLFLRSWNGWDEGTMLCPTADQRDRLLAATAFGLFMPPDQPIDPDN